MTENKTLDIVLESCPFCGGEATLDTRRDEKRRENPTYVKCSCCGARIRTFSRVREAIAAWNRCAKEHKGLGNIVELTSIKQEMQQLLDQLNSQECGDEAETYTSGYRVGHRNGQIELLRHLLKIDTGTLKGADHENR